MSAFSRADNSGLARWWWTVDRWMLLLLLLLVSLGLWMTLTASPAVAEKLGLDRLHFFLRQVVFLGLSLLVVLGVSVMPVTLVRRGAILAFPLTLVLMGLTLLVGPDIKGATRWLPVGPFTLQPSEFMKPVFIVTIAWLLSARFQDGALPVKRISLALFAVVATLLVLQPDFGQTILVGVVWLAQMTLAGLPVMWLLLAAVALVLALGVAYALVPHVADRIDTFINPASGDTYQTETAIRAFEAGGLIGRGPGEGSVKAVLPDAHTDYIFAVVGEEFGAIAGVLLMALFAGIVLRGLSQLVEEDDPFRLLATAGLLVQFGLQAMINIGVNLAVLPAKGMTLPFISYGGSSMLALALTIGMVLAFTRRNRFLRPATLGLPVGRHA
ncbi:FtsW/RodA/SpoVE family cell cycle protein [Yunchengibacter salinarum]|uniref:FtsW/RodA/SpoVE family cell cycle protein n=1 Tax=Yunchengibacter salinarum TaxID=3133399 RepID=UPI0035B65B36